MDVLKIDRSFVAGLAEGGKNPAIVSAMIDLAHALGMKVVAEGIESAEQLEQLKSLGADLGQGFLFSRPVANETLEELL